MTEQLLLLKWGTLKGFEGATKDSEFGKKLDEFFKIVDVAHGAIQQSRTKTHNDLLCEVIDSCEGAIFNDWSGEKMTKEEAKRYIMEYGAE